MSIQPDSKSPGELLSAIGLEPVETRIYETLLGRGGVDAAELAGTAGVQVAEATRALTLLLGKGLLSRSPGRRPTYAAVPPAIGLEPLVLRRQQELDNARVAVGALEDRFRNAEARLGTTDLVEVIVGHEAVAQRVEQLERMSQHELLEFSKPPYAVLPGRQSGLFDALARGVRCRIVYDRTALEYPGVHEDLVRLQKEGANARVHAALPIKLLIGDGRFGILPLTLSEPGIVDGALFVHASSLLEALNLLWGSFWQNATRITAELDVLEGADSVQLSEEDYQLLTLLLSGLKGKAVARALRLGESTVERRVKRLMSILGADTRFQAGYKLSQLQRAHPQATSVTIDPA